MMSKNDLENDDVIDFQMEMGADIETISKTLPKIMKKMDMNCIMTLPDGKELEFDKNCYPADIIEGFNKNASEEIRLASERTSKVKNSIKEFQLEQQIKSTDKLFKIGNVIFPALLSASAIIIIAAYAQSCLNKNDGAKKSFNRLVS